MNQCSQGDHFSLGPNGEISLKCDPFGRIKEPECLAKWQLLRTAELSEKLNRLVAAYESTQEIYRRFAPMQEKMFKHMEREIGEVEDADSWKRNGEDNDEAL